MSEDIALEDRLAVVESQIEAGLVAVGTGLARVSEKHLYKQAGYATYEVYCEKRWGFSPRRARQLVAGAEVVGTIGSGTNGSAPLPTNERQARALSAAPPEERADVMVAVAGKGKPTAAAIADEIEARHPKPAGVPPTPLGETPAPTPAPTPGPLPVETEQEPPHSACESCGTVTPAHALYDGWCDTCRLEAQRGASLRTKPPALDPAMERLKLRESILKRRKAAIDVYATFPPELVAAAMDDGEWDSWQEELGIITDWYRRLFDLRPKPGLRLMEGAK